MALTPDDVVTKQFQHVRFKEGFDPDEVDDFLDEIVVEWRKTIAENEELKAKLAAYESGASSRRRSGRGRRRGSRSRRRCRTGRRRVPGRCRAAAASAGIIELAQRLHDEHVAEGIAQRDKLIADAKAQAASIVVRGRDQAVAKSSPGSTASAPRSRAASPSCATSSATTARSCAATSRASSATSRPRRRRRARRRSRPSASRPALTGRPPFVQAAAGTIIAILAVLVLAADQFTKYLALENLPLEEPVAGPRRLPDLLPRHATPAPRSRSARASRGSSRSRWPRSRWSSSGSRRRACARGCGPSCWGCFSAACSATSPTGSSRARLRRRARHRLHQHAVDDARDLQRRRHLHRHDDDRRRAAGAGRAAPRRHARRAAPARSDDDATVAPMADGGSAVRGRDGRMPPTSAAPGRRDGRRVRRRGTRTPAATRTDVESRSLPVPDGLDGTRVDAALAKMLGFSRTFAADVAEAGGVEMDGRVLDEVRQAPRRRVARGGVGAAARSRAIVPVEVPDLGIVYDDDDIVVVDKPSGVAAHPSVGWEGPTVLGALAAGGYRIATTGAAERQGVVHRLDVGTSGLMVVAKTERAYTRAQARVQGARGREDLPRGRAGASRPARRNDRRAHRAASHALVEVRGRRPTGKDSVTHYETLEAFPGASLLEIHLETGRTHQIRVHMAAHRHPCVGDPLYGADPTLSARLGLTRQWLHATSCRSRTRRRGRDDVHVAVPRRPRARARGAARGVISRALDACSPIAVRGSCGC